MPISSGALDWPVSYFSKHEEPEVTPDIYDARRKPKTGKSGQFSSLTAETSRTGKRNMIKR